MTNMFRAAVLLGCAAGMALLVTRLDAQRPGSSGELRPARVVSGNTVTSAANPAVRIRVNPSFRYVGAERFILRDVADAEQHLFADAPDGKTIKRLYWLQFEQYLPGRGGTYNYDSDTMLNAWGLPWRTHVRRFADPPAPDSDRRRVHDLLARAGLAVPNPSVRARLVYVPRDDNRQELMIIYLEPAGATEPTTAERDALVQRAIAGLEITR